MKNFAVLETIKPRIFFWGKSITLSILDQGVFSGSNFLLNILLARWLSPNIFGDFSVLFSFFLLIGSIQNSIALEPMSVFGLSRHYENLNGYLDLLFVTQALVMFSLGGLIIGFSLFFRDDTFRQALLGLGFGAPAILCFWYLRRAFYLKGKIALSIVCNLIYAAVMLVGTMFLYQSSLLNTMTAFLMMSAAGLLSSIISIFFLKIDILCGVRLLFAPESKTIFVETWEYCKWVLLTVLVNWVASLSIIPMLKAFSGADQAAAYRTIQILYLPVQQILTAFQLFFLPWVSKRFVEKGSRFLHKTLQKVLFFSMVFVIFYLLVIQFSGNWLIEVFYESSFYNRYSWTIPLFSLSVFIGAIVQIATIGLRTINFPAAIFYSKLGATVFMLLAGLLLILKFGFLGAVIASIGSIFLELLIVFSQYQKRLGQ